MPSYSVCNQSSLRLPSFASIVLETQRNSLNFIIFWLPLLKIHVTKAVLYCQLYSKMSIDLERGGGSFKLKLYKLENLNKKNKHTSWEENIPVCHDMNYGKAFNNSPLFHKTKVM